MEHGQQCNGLEKSTYPKAYKLQVWLYIKEMVIGMHSPKAYRTRALNNPV
nr:MAG TPA: hypothetical protein [Caudoviricetes sp.]